MKKFTLKYGIDAPFWVFLLLISGTVMITVSNTFGFVKTLGLFLGGCGNVIIGLWMLLYSTIIKIKHRDVILDLAHTKKGDKLLVVGTGRGLLAISAAKRCLPQEADSGLQTPICLDESIHSVEDARKAISGYFLLDSDGSIW